VKHKFRPRLFHPSTLSFIREALHLRGYSFFDWLHGYVYGRWPYLYIGIGTGELPRNRVLRTLVRKVKRLFRFKAAANPSNKLIKTSSQQNLDSGTFADNYHGKVVTLEAAKKLVAVKEEVDLTIPEQVIPYSHARDIILQNPDHIIALECPCRASRPDPCQPLDVCLIVGEPFASFVAEHHPRLARWVNPDETMEMLQAEHERGHVHHAFFKDAMLGRFYAICNCCACCCGAMQAQRNGVPMLISSGYISQVDAKLCAGCGDCADACQFKAISVSHNKAVVDTDICMGCGVCLSRCKQKAHSLSRDPNKPEPLDIQELTRVNEQEDGQSPIFYDKSDLK
jgi:ferredoxin